MGFVASEKKWLCSGSQWSARICDLAGVEDGIGGFRLSSALCNHTPLRREIMVSLYVLLQAKRTRKDARPHLIGEVVNKRVRVNSGKVQKAQMDGKRGKKRQPEGRRTRTTK
jgi:hypothetical protein